MPPTVARELSIEYGNVGPIVIGGASDRILDSPMVVSQTADRGSVEFEFGIGGLASDAAFNTEIDTVEAAFRLPNQRLRIRQNLVDLYDFDPAANTGFNHQPSITKIGDVVADSGRSRRYRVAIEFDLPADVYGDNGARGVRAVIDLDCSNLATLTITGEWTSIPGVEALAGYLANIDALTTSFIPAGLTMELIDESRDLGQFSESLEFRRVLEEIIDTQGALLDDPEIAKSVLVVTPGRRGPGDTPDNDPRRFTELSVTYSACIRKDLTLDLQGKWENEIRQTVIDKALDRSGASEGAVMQEDPRFNLAKNRIDVSMRILAPSGSLFIEFRRTVRTSDQKGNVVTPGWNGDPLAAYVFQGPRNLQQTTTEVLRLLGTVVGQGGGQRRRGVGVQNGGFGAVAGAQFGAGGQGRAGLQPGRGGGIVGAQVGGGRGGNVGVQNPQQGGAGGGVNFNVEISETEDTTPLRLGVPPNTLDVTDITTVRVARAVNLLAGGAVPPTQQPITGGA